jgi:hypothetical protein
MHNLISTGVWLDHRVAKIVELEGDAAREHTLSAHSPTGDYYERIAELLAPADRIAIIGPDLAKFALARHLRDSGDDDDRIVLVVTCSGTSDAQLVAKVRSIFLRRTVRWSPDTPAVT